MFPYFIVSRIRKSAGALFLFAALAFMGAPAFAATVTILPDAAPPPPAETGLQTIVLAGGCFWGIEAVFEHVKGVQDAISGYAGGTESDANYSAVSAGQTTHAEVVKVTYDPAQVTLPQLLKIFFSIAHDPTQLNRQGPDTGTQYRSGIFYTSPAQQQTAQAYIAQLDKAGVFSGPIVTRVEKLDVFYLAEAHHQDYAARNPAAPYIVIHDKPKVKALKKTFPKLYDKTAD